jgi:hypothetical protein
MTDKTVHTPHGHDTHSPARRGERARVTPFSLYHIYKWSTVGTPFKSVKILIDFQCDIKSLTFICGPFNS